MTNPAPSPARIAYLGPPGTHSHAAALGLFGHGAALHPVAALPDLVASLGSSADYAVVPFANGKSGIVGLANDAIIARPGLKCWADRDHKVSHCLLARLDVAKPFEASERTEKESEIKELLNNVSVVYSHNEAIGQCSAFLSTFLPHARLERVQSTARAAELASQEPNSAALASEVCSEIYGIPCVARDAQDADDNTTRFLVLSLPDSPAPTLAEPPSPPTRSMLYLLPRPPTERAEGGASEIIGTKSYALNLGFTESLAVLTERNVPIRNLWNRPAGATADGRARYWYILDILVNEKGLEAILAELKERGGCEKVECLGVWG